MKTARDFALAFPTGAFCNCNTEGAALCKRHEQIASLIETAMDAAAQDAYERAAHNGDWQPIATAPKDGSRILVCTDDYVTISYWDRDEGYEAWRDTDGERIESPEPNSWMPLPDASRALAEREAGRRGEN